jgi:SSS family solute:Na+ symporter
MAAYGAAVLAIGWIANRRQKTSEDYFLGGRRLRWWLVGVSLIATSFSSVSLIGGTGFGFAVGMRWLQLQIGDLLALGLVCVLFLPFFSRLGLTTAYEYLERRFGVVARTLASALFIVQTLLRAAILVYAPALALATILGWPLPVAIVVTAAAAIVYSACGGLAAVVWTDLIQLAVIVFGVSYCLVLVAGDVPGGLGAVVEGAGDRLDVVTWSAAPSTPFNLLGALLPYAVLAFSLFGTGQQAVQRFLSCNDLAGARRAAMTGWVVGTLTLGLTLFLGVCLRAWAEHASPGLLMAKSDSILPEFIDQRLPAGVAGLMLAAIFAASMSSLDSAIHSMSTATIVDFQRRFARVQPTAAGELRLARWTTVAFGVWATTGALIAARAGKGMLELLITWLGYFAGPLLGLFLLGMLTRRANQRGVLIGVGTAFAAVAAVLWNFGLDRLLGIPGPAPDEVWLVHPLWLAPFSCAVTLLVGWTASLAFPAPDPDRLRGLTRAVPPEPGPAGL